MTERRGHLVPILDYGVTIDRGDHVIVVLDAVGPDDVQREIEAVLTVLAQGQQRRERREEEGACGS